MKKRLFWLYALLCLLASVIFIGPRIDLHYSPENRSLPLQAAALPDYLQQREGRYRDLVAGTAKKIVWAGAAGQKTEYCLLYFPGFSATHPEIQPVPQKIAEALGANAFYTRFRGHGRGGPAMLDGSVNAWLNDAHEALEIGRLLGEKTIIMGVSTGASLATLVASEATQLHALLLISPNYGLKDSRSRLLTWPWGKQLAQWVIGQERSWTPQNPAEAKYWTWKYPTAAILPMMGVVQLTQALDLSQQQTPVLMIYSPQDQVISAQQVEAAYAQWGAKTKNKWAYTGSSAPSQHVLAGDIKAPESTGPVTERMLQFLSLLNTPASHSPDSPDSPEASTAAPALNRSEAAS